jgi:L,D-transpeptidase catalytic domain
MNIARSTRSGVILSLMVALGACATDARTAKPHVTSGPALRTLPTAEVTAVSSSSNAAAIPPTIPEMAALPEILGDVQDKLPVPPPAPRLHAIKGIPSILNVPDKHTGKYIGYIRVGESVTLRQTETVPGVDCSGGFFAIEPRGYVCNDSFVSRNPQSEHVISMAATAPKAGPYPYRYAVSNGAPMYNRIPTHREQARFEAVFGPVGKFEKLPPFLAAHEDLALNEPILPTDTIPSFLERGQMIRPGRFGLVRQKIPRGSMLSYTKAFAVEGRTYLLSVDLTAVPADRVRPFKPSSFRGFWLDNEHTLPIAWFRRQPRVKWRKSEGGTFESLGISFEARTYARLTGQSMDVAGTKYLETKERHGADVIWVADEDATVVEVRSKLPFGVREGQKWILVRITQGTLVAYEGLRPVYSTLISPGAGGVPTPGIDLVKASTTPLGTYNITFKDRAATMSPEFGENRSFWIADVPHTQYFRAPFALHAAYWHERFGEPTSAGCVNLSPIDAEIVFQWSDPPVPPGWQGAVGAGAAENGPTTAVVVAR